MFAIGVLVARFGGARAFRCGIVLCAKTKKIIVNILLLTMILVLKVKMRVQEEICQSRLLWEISQVNVPNVVVWMGVRLFKTPIRLIRGFLPVSGLSPLWVIPAAKIVKNFIRATP